MKAGSTCPPVQLTPLSPTCSPVAPDAGTSPTMTKYQGVTHFCGQNDVNFYSKFLLKADIFLNNG